jgi:hypothetical protein
MPRPFHLSDVQVPDIAFGLFYSLMSLNMLCFFQLWQPQFSRTLLVTTVAMHCTVGLMMNLPRVFDSSNSTRPPGSAEIVFISKPREVPCRQHPVIRQLNVAQLWLTKYVQYSLNSPT